MKDRIASITLALTGLLGVIYSLELVGCIASAQAAVVTVLPAAPAEPATDWRLTLLAIGTGISIALHGLQPFLRWLAPRTRTTLDDRLLDFDVRMTARFDQLLALLPGAAAALGNTTVNVTTAPPRDPQAGVARPLLLFFLAGAIGGAIGVGAISCATSKHVTSAGKDSVVSCAKADAGPLLVLAGELGADAAGAALHTGKVDWDALVDRALAQGLEIGGCAFVALYHALESKEPEPTSRSLAAAPDPRRAALERLRAQLGGVRWELADGTVL